MFGNHIGDYIRYKLKKEGRAIKYLADGMGMSRQNLNNTILNKKELLPSRLKRIESVLGAGFFDEYFEKNKELSRFFPSMDPVTREMTMQSKGGINVNIQLNPEGFDELTARDIFDKVVVIMRDHKEKIMEETKKLQEQQQRPRKKRKRGRPRKEDSTF